MCYTKSSTHAVLSLVDLLRYLVEVAEVGERSRRCHSRSHLLLTLGYLPECLVMSDRHILAIVFNLPSKLLLALLDRNRDLSDIASSSCLV